MLLGSTLIHDPALRNDKQSPQRISSLKFIQTEKYLLHEFINVCFSVYICIPLYHSTVLPLCRSSALAFDPSTALLLYRSTILPFYRSIAVPFYRSIALPLYGSTTLPLYHSTICSFATIWHLLWLSLRCILCANLLILLLVGSTIISFAVNLLLHLWCCRECIACYSYSQVANVCGVRLVGILTQGVEQL